MPIPTAPHIDTARALGDIEGFLKQCIRAMTPDPKPEGPGRPRVLPALALWAGLWVCLLRGFQSQRAIWWLLSERGLWFFPRFCVTDQAVYNRLANADTDRAKYAVRLVTFWQGRTQPHASMLDGGTLRWPWP